MKTLRCRRPAWPVLLLLWGCGREARPVGVVVSDPAIPAAHAAAAAAGPGTVRLRVEQLALPTAAQPALSVARRLVEAGAIAVVGHSNSAASLAASQVYNRAGVVQIAPTTTAAVYSQAGPYSFRLVPSDRDQARLLARAALQLGGGRPVAVMYENDDYGHALYTDFSLAADSLRLPVAVAGGFLHTEGLATARAVLDALLRREPQVLLWLGRTAPLDSLYPELRSSRPELSVIASDGLDNAATHRNAGGRFTDLYFVRLLDPALQARAALRLRGAVDAAEVGAEGLLVYDAVGLLRAAVAAGAGRGSEVAAYLRSLGRTRPPYQGITGLIQFDAERSVQRPWQLARVSAQGVLPVVVKP